MSMRTRPSGFATFLSLLRASRRFGAGLLLTLLLTLAGCDKKTQRAEVTAKDYVAAAPKDGTPLTDERQLDHERWLINVEMDDRRRTHVDVTPEAWRALKVGDRVQVDYEQGRYTGTLWGRRLEKLP